MKSSVEEVQEIWANRSDTIVYYLISMGLQRYVDKMVKNANDNQWKLLTMEAQNAWAALPDSPSIHKPGFSSLCDLAEYYCFGDWP